MQDQLITKYADALDKLVAVPQPVRYITDPATGREIAVDMEALSAGIDAMRYTDRCFLCNHDVVSEMQGCMPGDGLRMCLDRLACHDRRLALHARQVA